eukprot:14025673-Ditylum_brightwellii.AAC.1
MSHLHVPCTMSKAPMVLHKYKPKCQRRYPNLIKCAWTQYQMQQNDSTTALGCTQQIHPSSVCDPLDEQCASGAI